MLAAAALLAAALRGPGAEQPELSCTAAASEALLAAAEAGSTEEIASLLARGTDVNRAGYLGWTALHEAAYRGNEAMVKLLLEHGAKVDARTENVMHARGGSLLKTPLFAAAAAGEAGVARILLDHGADLGARGNWGATALHRAAAEGEVEVAKVLLERGAVPNVRTESGETPLHWAIQHQGKSHWHMKLLWDEERAHMKVASAPMIELLLARGADVNARDDRGWTPLHWAAGKGHKKLAMLLVEKGADPSATMTEQYVRHWPVGPEVRGAAAQGVLHLAAGGGDLELVKVTLARGVPVDLRDNTRTTPLHEASRGGHADVARFLLSRGADADAEDSGGWMPIHHAAYGGRAEVVELLLARGAQVNAATPREQRMPPKPKPTVLRWWRDVRAGSTPLHLAAASEEAAAARVLVENGAHVNVWDSKGSTPLHLAVNHNRPATVKVLAEHAADVNARDQRGWTPLHEAAYQGLLNCTTTLIELGADPSIRDETGKTALDYCGATSPARPLLLQHEARE
jgi:ankyrin repeat protein